MQIDRIKQFVGNRTISIVEAMQKIDENGEGILFIADDEGVLLGSISDGDIRRWLIKTGNLNTDADKVMTRSPVFLYAEEEDRALMLMKQKAINAVPILDRNKRIKDIILLSSIDENNKTGVRGLEDVSVVIMAGGRGSRLYPYTKILPKPLIPIGEIPIVERIIDSFRKYDVAGFYMSINYKKGMIKSYFKEMESDYPIRYVEEDMPLGTAGSIKLIEDPPDKPFFVTNCDILILADYADIYDHHINAKNDITIVSALKNITVPYGVLDTGVNGELMAIREKPRNSYLINTGMYILDPKLIDLIPDKKEYHMTGLIDDVLKNGGKVGMYPVSEDSFLDMGEFSEMKRMEDKLNIMIPTQDV